VPGVLVLHHILGWDSDDEAARKFAHNGFAAIAPNLFFRFGEGSSTTLPRGRGQQGVPRRRGDWRPVGAISYLREQPTPAGKIGVIGFSLRRRHTYLAACTIPTSTPAVDCRGGGVVVNARRAHPKRPVAPIDLTRP